MISKRDINTIYFQIPCVDGKQWFQPVPITKNPVDPGKSPSELEIPAVPDPQALEDPWDSRRNARTPRCRRPILLGVGAWISGECCLLETVNYTPEIWRMDTQK